MIIAAAGPRGDWKTVEHSNGMIELFRPDGKLYNRFYLINGPIVIERRKPKRRVAHSLKPA